MTDNRQRLLTAITSKIRSPGDNGVRVVDAARFELGGKLQL
jgi:hypothetical protein